MNMLDVSKVKDKLYFETDALRTLCKQWVDKPSQVKLFSITVEYNCSILLFDDELWVSVFRIQRITKEIIWSVNQTDILMAWNTAKDLAKCHYSNAHSGCHG